MRWVAWFRLWCVAIDICCSLCCFQLLLQPCVPPGYGLSLRLVVILIAGQKLLENFLLRRQLLRTPVVLRLQARGRAQILAWMR